MKTLIFYLVTFYIIKTYRIQYPNCLTQVKNNLLQTANTTKSFNLNFIQLTNFLHEGRKQVVKQAAISHIQTGSNKQIKILQQQLLKQYIIIGCIVITFIIVILTLRLLFHNAKTRIQAFIDRYIGKLLSPCATILGITLFIFLVFTSGIINQLYDDLDKAVCQSYYIDQIILNGSKKDNWWGLQQYSDNLHYLNNQFLEAFRSMNGSYDFSVQLMDDGIYKNQGFEQQLEKQFSNAYINYEGNYVKFQQILPNFFGNQPTTLTKINNTMNNLIDLSKKAKQVQISVSNLKISRQNLNYSSFDKVTSLFDRNKQSYKNSQQFTPNQIIQIINQNQWLIRLSQVYLFLGFQSSIGYVITVYLLGKSIRQKQFKRLANAFWFCLMCQVCISILMAYSFDQASILTQGYCYAIDQIKTNSTTYNQTASARKNNLLIDTYGLLYPCLFEEGNFSTSSQIYYIDKASFQVITNLYQYVNMMDKTHQNYKDAFLIFDTLDESSQQIQNQQHNRYKTWNYLNRLLIDLNSLTLGKQCYNHHWVFDRNECLQGQNILPSMNNNLLTYGQQQPQTTCLSFNILNSVGEVDRTIQFSQFLSNYVNHQHDNCTSQYQRIFQIGEDILAANQLKAQAIKGIIQKINNQKQHIFHLLSYQRMNYILKKQQYLYLLTNQGKYQEDSTVRKKWQNIISHHSNCSCIQTQLSSFNELLCINFRADVNKLVICVIVSTVMLGTLFIVGFFIGFHQQLIWTILPTEPQVVSNNSNNSNNNSSVNIHQPSSNNQIQNGNQNDKENQQGSNIQQLKRKLTRKDTNSTKKPATIFSSQNNTISQQNDQ